MGEKKPQIFGSSDEISESINRIREQGAATETIDLENLVSSSQITLSGSFDLRSVQESSLAKLLAILPIPALLVDHSQAIVFANDICADRTDKGKSLEGVPLSSIVTGLEEAMKFDTLVEMVFSERKPIIINATLNLGKGPLWARTHMRSVRVGATRFVLLMVEDLTLERQQLLLTKKHEQELLKARIDLENTVKERTAELKRTNELLKKEVGIRQEAEQQLRKSHTQLENLVDERTAALKGTNARLLQAKNEWERTFDAVPDLIFLLDTDHRIIRANAVVLNRLGRTWSGVIGARCYEIMHGLKEPPPYCPHSKLLVDGKPHSVEIFEERLNAMIEVTVSPLRDKTGTLIGSVHVARDITQRKQMEYKLIESEKRYRELVDRASDVLYQTDANGLFVLCNPAISRITGYSEDELIGKHFMQLIHPDYKKSVDRFYRLQFVKKIPETDYEFAILTKDGQTVWLTQRVQLLLEGEEIVGFQAICRDITELKKAQISLVESEKRYRELVERAGDIIYQIDANGFFTVCNPVASRITGYSQEELIGKHYLELIHPEYKKPTERFYGLQLTKKIPETYYEFAAVSKQGETIWFAQRVQAVMEGETIVGFQAICRDVTELKKAQMALGESEQRYRQLIELAPDGIYVRVDGQCVFANPAMAALLGVEHANDLVGKPVMDFYHPDCHRTVRQRIQELSEVDDALPPVELRLIRSDGAILDVEVTAAALIYQGKRASQVVMRDITDRKRTQEALWKSEERLELALRGGDLGMWDYNLQTREAFFSRRGMQVAGYPAEEVEPDISWWGRRVHPEDISRVVRAFNDHMAGRSPMFDCEHRVSRKSGEYIWISTRGKLVERDEKGNPLRIVGTSLDITDRKRTEEALQKSEERLELALKGADLGMWDYNLQTREAFFNTRRAEMVGYSLEETEPDISWWGKRVHPEDVNRVIESFNAHADGRLAMYECEHRLQHKSGEYIWTAARGKIVERDDKGNPLRIVGTSLDITDRKRAEKALRKSEEQYRMLVETMGESLVILDENGKVSYVNNRFCELSGYSRDEVIGRSVEDFAGRVDQKLILEQLELRRQGRGGSYETVVTNKDGRQFHVLVSSRPIIQSGIFTGTFSVVTDITERKGVEERLKGSLQEKEILLKEIHHRVKNNLQIITSLLQLQSFHLEDKSAAGVLEDLENRVMAIATVHEKLYQSESLMRIDVREYVQDLVEHLFYSYGPATGGIGLTIDIHNITCGIDTAVPLGLIVSELISNSLKHGFPNGRTGTIAISLDLEPGAKFELNVSDNGIGMARDLQELASETLGLSLVKSLADQLHAEVRLDRTQGTHYRFRFKEVEKQRR